MVILRINNLVCLLTVLRRYLTHFSKLFTLLLVFANNVREERVQFLRVGSEQLIKSSLETNFLHSDKFLLLNL